MKVGDKLVVTRNGNISQSYLPWGSVCTYIKSFDEYICILFEEEEMLINKQLLKKLNNESR